MIWALPACKVLNLRLKLNVFWSAESMVPKILMAPAPPLALVPLTNSKIPGSYDSMTSAVPSAVSLVTFILTVTSFPTMTDGSENEIFVLEAQDII